MSADQLALALRASMPGGLDSEADWPDVLRRAVAVPAPRRREARRARVPGALAAALVVVGGAAALGAPRLLGPHKGAPTVTTVEQDLRSHPVGQRPGGVGFDARVIPGSTRLVTTLALARGGTARLYVAATRRGLPCFATTGRPFGRTGCQLASDPRLLWARWGSWLNRRHTVVGHAAPRATRSVAIVFRGGARQIVPRVVGGWFLAELPPGRVPVALVARDRAGEVLARTIVHVSFGTGRAPDLLRCSVRTARRVCQLVPRTDRQPLPRSAVPPATAWSLAFVQPVRRRGQDCVRVRLLRDPAWSVTCFGRVGWQGLGAALIVRAGGGTVSGRIGGGVARVAVRYADGDRSSAIVGPQTFQVPLPSWRRRGPHRPVEVLGLDRAGMVVTRRSIPPA
jgi:hypothetical protein